MKLHRLRSSSKHKILFVAAAAFAVCSIAFALPHTHATLGPSAPKPATVYEFKDQDTYLLQVRAQRNF